MRAMQEAPVEDLAAVGGVGAALAERIKLAILSDAGKRAGPTTSAVAPLSRIRHFYGSLRSPGARAFLEERLLS